jgi:hypothetical protein
LRRVVVDDRAIVQQVLEEQFLRIWPQYILFGAWGGVVVKALHY